MEKWIIENKDWVVPVVVALLSLGGALLGGWLSGKKRIGIEVLSKNRQEWINNLRNDVSKLMSLVHSAPVAIVGKPKNNDEKYIFLYNLFFDIQMTTYHIELLLNPSKPKHIELTKAIYKFVVFFDRTFIQYEEEMTSDYISSNIYKLLDHLKLVKEITQEILKTEWERVKKGV